MQANQTQVVWTVVIAAIVLLVVGLFAVSSVNQNLKLIDVDVDEQAIADAVLAGIVIPELPVVDTKKLDALWDNLFGEEIGLLEDKAEDYVSNHVNVEWADMREYVEDNLEDFDNFPFSKVFTLDVDETEITIVDLGEVEINSITYNEDEDSKVVVTLEYNFEYEKDTGVVGDSYRGTLYVTADYTYDFEDAEEVEFAYSL